MSDEAMVYHVPVMLEECLEALALKSDGKYADVTFGGGGHSRALLQRLGQDGHLYGFDQDADAVAGAPQDGRFTFVRSNFRYLRRWMDYYEVDGLDGVLADLGVSSHHFDTAERGFSIRQDGPLDMRMNRSGGMTAADVVNQYDQDRLAELFRLYGELRCAGALAKALVKARQQQPVETTARLQAIAQPMLDRSREKKDMAKVFQALRIEVNHELEALNDMLAAAVEVLKPGGRLVVLSYHSLEDRLVKNFMRSGNRSGVIEKDFYGNTIAPMRMVKGLAAEPGKTEQERNPRSRSAHMRVAEKVAADR